MTDGTQGDPRRGRAPVLPRATIVLLGAAGVAVTAAVPTLPEVAPVAVSV